MFHHQDVRLLAALVAMLGARGVHAQSGRVEQNVRIGTGDLRPQLITR